MTKSHVRYPDDLTDGFRIILSTLIMLSVLIPMVFIIYAGFYTTTFDDYTIRQEGVSYQTAHYSRIDCGVDIDGDYVCDPTYWQESASDTWEFVADDGRLRSSNLPTDYLSFNRGYRIFSMNGCPPRWQGISRVNFSSFRRHQIYKYKVMIDDVYNINLEEFKVFSKNRQRGNSVSVDFWYAWVRGVRSM